jgi:hypothetical protein
LTLSTGSSSLRSANEHALPRSPDDGKNAVSQPALAEIAAMTIPPMMPLQISSATS